MQEIRLTGRERIERHRRPVNAGTGACTRAAAFAFLLVPSLALAQAAEPEPSTAAADPNGEAPASAGGESPPATEAGPDGPPSVTESGSPERADALRRYEIAVERADAGDCELAIAEFEEIYRLLENPVVFFNMAICYEELHRYDDALSSYQRYLEEAAPGADSRGEVERALRRLEGFLGTVTVRSNVAASVWIDDREAGQSPGEFRVPAGSHAVELRAAGHESAQQEVVVASGRVAELSFELEELAEEYGGLSSGFFWASAAVTALSLGAAVALGVVTLGKKSDYGELYDQLDGRESSFLSAERETVHRFALTTDVLWGVTALFATTTVIFALVTDWGNDEDGVAEPTVSVTPTVGREQAGLLLRGAF